MAHVLWHLIRSHFQQLYTSRHHWLHAKLPIPHQIKRLANLKMALHQVQRDVLISSLHFQLLLEFYWLLMKNLLDFLKTPEKDQQSVLNYLMLHFYFSLSNVTRHIGINDTRFYNANFNMKWLGFLC